MESLCETCNRPKDIAGNEMCLEYILARNPKTCEEYESNLTDSGQESAIVTLAKELLECLNDEMKSHGQGAETTLVTIDRAIDVLYGGK